MGNNKFVAPSYAIDTNIVYYLAMIECQDDYFYLEAFDSNTYSYVPNAKQLYPELLVFEKNNDFSSPEYNKFMSEHYIQRMNIKSCYKSGILSTNLFKGCPRESLPRILQDGKLGYLCLIANLQNMLITIYIHI